MIKSLKKAKRVCVFFGMCLIAQVSDAYAYRALLRPIRPLGLQSRLLRCMSQSSWKKTDDTNALDFSRSRISYSIFRHPFKEEAERHENVAAGLALKIIRLRRCDAISVEKLTIAIPYVDRLTKECTIELKQEVHELDPLKAALKIERVLEEMEEEQEYKPSRKGFDHGNN